MNRSLLTTASFLFPAGKYYLYAGHFVVEKEG